MKSDSNKEFADVADIYNGLSEVKRAIWIGNGNLLLASQQAEKENATNINDISKERDRR